MGKKTGVFRWLVCMSEYDVMQIQQINNIVNWHYI